MLRSFAGVAALFFVTSGVAFAAIERPNGLDRRVDAIAESTLLSQPAIALVDPARQAAAERLADLTLPGFFATALLQALALAYFWYTGGAAALRDRLARIVRRPWLLRLCFGASLALIARVAGLVPAFYLYRVDRIMGLSVELTRTWALYWLGHTLLAMLVAGAIAAIVLWLVDRTHQWYLYTIVAILAASIAWSYAAPYFEDAGARSLSAVSEPLASQLHDALTRAGVPRVPVYIQRSSESPVGSAVAQGLGESRRVVISDTLVAGSTPAEVVFRVAYEIGHALHADPLFAALIQGGIVIVFSALAVVVADRIGFRRDDDPLSRLALVGALLAVLYVAAVPVRNAALRSYDMDADRYAVAVTGDRAAAVRSFVRATDQRMDEVCPDLWSRLFIDVHPSPAQRVEAINGVPARCP